MLSKRQMMMLTDTVGMGLGLWLLGLVLGMIAWSLGFAEADIGLFVLPFLVPVTFLAAHWRLAGKGGTSAYHVGVGLAWLVIALAFDYVIIVKGFDFQGFYGLNEAIGYALTFLIPILVGEHYRGRRGNRPAPARKAAKVGKAERR
jgi:hypothetical protein